MAGRNVSVQSVAGMPRQGTRDAGQLAYAEKRWADAFSELTAADAGQPLEPADLERLAIAAHCIGKNDQSTGAWTRAYDAHLEAGDIASAALAAAWCSFGLMTRGEFAMGGGWLGRVQALCQDNDLDCPAAWFARGQMAAGAMFGGDYVDALSMFEEAQRNADRLGDPNGMTLTRLGRSQ